MTSNHLVRSEGVVVSGQILCLAKLPQLRVSSLYGFSFLFVYVSQCGQNLFVKNAIDVFSFVSYFRDNVNNNDTSTLYSGVSVLRIFRSPAKST